MNWDSLKKQLAREAREYLADLRNWMESLKRAEGVATLALIVAVVIMLVVYFKTALGFDNLGSIYKRLGASNLPDSCMPLDDTQAFIFILNAVVMVLLTVLSLGEMMQLLDRVRDQLPPEPRKVAMPVALMLVMGISGIIAMKSWC